MAIPNQRYESRVPGFNDSEYGDGVEEPAGVEAALASLEPTEEEAQDQEDPELGDVDLRLETADYYRAILKHDFFDAGTPAAQIVDREIRTFIRERLEVLLGLRAPRAETAEQPFDADELNALRALARKVLGKPALIAGEPTVKKMPAPAASRAEAARPVQKPKPAVKKIPVPPAAPSSKPKPKMQAQPIREPKAAPVQVRAAPVPQVVHEPGVEGGVTQTFVGHDGKQVTLIEGEIIEEGGRKFKVEANGAGTLYRRDITGQVVPNNRIPPMNERQMSIMSQQLAEQQLGMLDETTGMAVVASLTRT